jgi:hypothetical protein
MKKKERKKNQQEDAGMFKVFLVIFFFACLNIKTLLHERKQVCLPMDPHCIFFMNESQQFIYCLLRFIATFDFLRTDLIAKNPPWSRLMVCSKNCHQS